ncbi:MAG: NUDIX domain-containing protein [Sphingomonas sp.]
MGETDFLAGYDPDAFARPSVAVDLVLLTVAEGGLAALLQQRQDHPHKGDWGLPGSFVGIEEGVDDAARRVLATKAGIDTAYLEQLYTFGAPARDPRMRIITIAYFALLPADVLVTAVQDRSDLAIVPLVPLSGEQSGRITARRPGQEPLPLAFDHAEILGHAVKRLRRKLDYSQVAFALLPALFTLRALQDVHEAILGTTLGKPAFRRRMLDKGWIEGTGLRESGASFRPAELYRLIAGE